MPDVTLGKPPEARLEPPIPPIDALVVALLPGCVVPVPRSLVPPVPAPVDAVVVVVAAPDALSEVPRVEPIVAVEPPLT